MFNKVVFRVDASPNMGIGHVSRCLALARELSDRNFDVYFVCQESGSGANVLVEREGFALIPFAGDGNRRTTSRTDHRIRHSLRKDAEATSAILRKLGAVHWLVVDHYSLNKSWENQLRSRCKRLMVIDDSADRTHDCDLLLNQNIGVDTLYSNVGSTNHKLLLGPQWALLRNEFSIARSRLRRRSGEVNRVLVSFGGSDPTGETIKVINAIRSFDYAHLRFDIVIGLLNSRKREIEALSQTIPGARCHFQTENIAHLMAESDLAFGAAGTSALERLAVGLPTIVVAVADNQLAIMENLNSRGLVISVGVANEVSFEAYASALSICLQKPQDVFEISQRSLATVDGLGAQRVALELEKLS